MVKPNQGHQRALVTAHHHEAHWLLILVNTENNDGTAGVWDMMRNCDFHALLQSFFLKRLMQQRNLSTNTVSSYRDTFKLYIMFLQTEHGVTSEKITMTHMDSKFIEGFCQYLIQERDCSSATVNNRLSARKSFLKYALEQNPEHSETIRQSLMVPFRKQEKSDMCFISRTEFDAHIAQCDTNTAIGTRDKLMLLLLYNTGVRVAVLLNVHSPGTYDENQPTENSADWFSLLIGFTLSDYFSAKYAKHNNQSPHDIK